MNKILAKSIVNLTVDVGYNIKKSSFLSFTKTLKV